MTDTKNILEGDIIPGQFEGDISDFATLGDPVISGEFSTEALQEGWNPSVVVPEPTTLQISFDVFEATFGSDENLIEVSTDGDVIRIEGREYGQSSTNGAEFVNLLLNSLSKLGDAVIERAILRVELRDNPDVNFRARVDDFDSLIMMIESLLVEPDDFRIRAPMLNPEQVIEGMVTGVEIASLAHGVVIESAAMQFESAADVLSDDYYSGTLMIVFNEAILERAETVPGRDGAPARTRTKRTSMDLFEALAWIEAEVIERSGRISFMPNPQAAVLRFDPNSAVVRYDTRRRAFSSVKDMVMHTKRELVRRYDEVTEGGETLAALEHLITAANNAVERIRSVRLGMFKEPPEDRAEVVKTAPKRGEIKRLAAVKPAAPAEGEAESGAATEVEPAAEQAQESKPKRSHHAKPAAKTEQPSASKSGKSGKNGDKSSKPARPSKPGNGGTMKAAFEEAVKSKK